MPDNYTNILRVLNQYGEIFVSEYRQNIGDSLSNASGKLGGTASYKVVSNRKGNTQHFEVQISLESYWKWLENGRRPGKIPPVESIIKWVKKKNLPVERFNLPQSYSLEKKQRSAGWAIAKTIAKNGTSGKHIFEKTSNDVFKEFESSLIEAITMDFNNELINIFAILQTKGI